MCGIVAHAGPRLRLPWGCRCVLLLRMTPHYRQSFLVALTGHFLLIIAAVVVSVVPGCHHPPPVDLSAFDHVDIYNIDTTKPLSRIKPPSENVTPPPAQPPAQVPTPAMPDAPVPPKASPKPPDPTPAPKPAHDAEGVSPERTPHKPAPSNTSSTAVGAVPVVRSNIRATRVSSAPGPRRPSAVRPLTPGELDPLGGLNAPLGASNSVPMDERQRCLLLIKRVLYDAWDRPTLADAGHQSALLEVRFDLSGRVVGAAIAQSSGSESMDHSVLLAARAVTRVEGLTTGFLKEYPKLTVEFTVTE